MAVGAPGRRARPGGLGLPRERRRPARFSASLPLSLPGGPESGLPRSVRADGLGKWGVGARPAVPRSQVPLPGGGGAKHRPPSSSARRSQRARVSPTAGAPPPSLPGSARRAVGDARGSRHPRHCVRGGRPPSLFVSSGAAAASPQPSGITGSGLVAGARALRAAGPRRGGGPASRFPAAAPPGSAPVKSHSARCLFRVFSRAEPAPSPLFAG